MITNFASSEVLSAMCGKKQYASLASRAFIGLSSTEPHADGTNVTEPAGNGYARKQIGYYSDTSSQYMGNPSGGVISNSQEIHFNEATGAWGTQRYACIYDAATGGHLIAWGELGEEVEGEWTPVPITPTANTVVVIRPGNLRISLV